jgi:hypothetical protein
MISRHDGTLYCSFGRTGSGAKEAGTLVGDSREGGVGAESDVLFLFVGAASGDFPIVTAGRTW